MRETKSLIKKRRKAWYEKYRWFISSDGIVVIGGRDAKTNEYIVKRLAKDDDIIFHADIYGGPFVLLPSKAKSKSSTIAESAIFAASYSNAWKAGFRSIDVYWVYASQLSKKAKPGEYLRPGSFVIRGKRNYLKGVKLELSVGLEEKNANIRIMVGPSTAIMKHCKVKIDIVPGKMRKTTAAKEIVNKLLSRLGRRVCKEEINILANDLINLLPPGGVEIRGK